MGLYRHYKNKFYKYRGIVRHSESLEELVLYDTLYENDKGRTWVRPKDLFFGNIMIDGETRPRFAPVKLEIREWTAVGDQEVELIAPLIKQAFGDGDKKWFYDKFNQHSAYFLLIAYLDGQAIGFKIGYEQSPESFYSWLGGVIPEYRKFGVATELMKRQHEWCRERGYTSVMTKTQNRFRPMLLLNIRHGFNITGVVESSEGQKIVLRKSLQD